jgi:hypothetical protein
VRKEGREDTSKYLYLQRCSFDSNINNQATRRCIGRNAAIQHVYDVVDRSGSSVTSDSTSLRREQYIATRLVAGS